MKFSTFAGWAGFGAIVTLSVTAGHQHKLLTQIETAQAIEDAEVASAAAMAASPAPKPARTEDFMNRDIVDRGGPQEKYPVRVMSDRTYVIVAQPREDDPRGPVDRIVMNRAFAVKVLEALKEAVDE